MLEDLHREMRIVRLGQGVDATGEFAPDALLRTQLALVDYAEMMREHGVEAVRMVATSAARDVANRDAFFAMTAEVLGRVVPGAVAEVITGAEEAELSFRGAVGELDSAAAASNPFALALRQFRNVASPHRHPQLLRFGVLLDCRLHPNHRVHPP